MQNIFEYAARKKLRFPSAHGELTAEQLWDVPLRDTRGFNLNEIAKGINRAVKDASEENFVTTTVKTPDLERREVALAVVKHVIEVKLAEEKAASERAAKKREKEQLLEILAKKQAGELDALSVEDLQKRIAALED